MSQATGQTNRDAPAAIYCRTATTGSTISTQLQACQGFAWLHGYEVPEAYVCLDEGYSGLRLERPGLQRLRGLIRTRAIQAVIVSDLARLSRTVSDQLRLADECDHAEVHAHAVLSASVPTRDNLTPLLNTLRLIGEQQECIDEPTA
jgi:DNA invertase Pin-like site-specific DNA recombinase